MSEGRRETKASPSVMIGSNIPKYEDLFSTNMDKVEVMQMLKMQVEFCCTSFIIQSHITLHCAQPDQACT